jgi:uncharacterized DUF497 family protein
VGSQVEGFEWDPAKAAYNVANHGVSFEEATTVFDDPDHYTEEDLEHSEHEDRERTIGVSTEGRLLFVVHTARGRDLDVIRLISARIATARERRRYFANVPD